MSQESEDFQLGKIIPHVTADGETWLGIIIHDGFSLTEVATEPIPFQEHKEAFHALAKKNHWDIDGWEN